MAESGRTSPDGNKSFKSKHVKFEEQAKTDNTKDNLSKNKRRKNKAKNNPPDGSKIESIKSMGQALISRYFKGFTSLDRANIQADLDDSIAYRLIDSYQPSIRAYAEWKNYSNAEDYSKSLDTRLFGGISLALAVKLHISSTDTERKANKLLSSLESKIILPKKLGVLIDQLGRSDIANDNHFRIRNQNFAAKRHLARAIYNLIPQNELSEYMDDHYGMKWNDLNVIMENNELFSNMVDDSIWSMDRIKLLGRQVYEKATAENFEFWQKGKDKSDAPEIFTLRLPKVDFDTLDLIKIGKIMSNGLFKSFSFDQDLMTKMASGLVLSVSKYTWLKSPASKMKDLDTKFNGTWFADKTYNQILNYCGIWNLGYFFNDLVLNNLALEAIKRWNTAYSKPLQAFLDMNEIPFAEHGSDAQLIQVDRQYVSDKKSIMDYVTYKFMKKSDAKSVLKIGENNALLGAMVGFTKNLEFKSDWQVEFNSTNSAMLYEFLKNDFKDGY